LGGDVKAPAAGAAWGPWIGRVIAVAAAAMLLYAALTVWSGIDRLGAALARFPNVTLAWVAVLVILGWSVRAARWHYFVRRLGWPVPLGPSLLAFLASFALTATPGKAGEVVKAGLLRARFAVPMADTAGVLLVERLGDLLAVLILAAGGLALLADARFYFAVCLALVAGIAVFVSGEWLHRPLLMRLGTLPGLARPAAKALEMLGTGRSLLRPLPFAAGLGLAVLAWACEAYAFHLILAGFGFSVPALTSFSVYGVSTIVGALSLLPGGVGGVEAAMLLLLNALGIGAADAVAPVVLTRFSTLWLISLLGFVFMGLWWLGARGRPAPEQSQSAGNS
jgi:uncharacterized membrane protein YbhN (UPF0104 family)